MPANKPVYLFPWIFSKSSSGMVRLNWIAIIIPKKIKLQPISSINDGKVWRNISAKMIVNGICIEKSNACLLGPNLLRHINKKVSPIIIPMIEDKTIAVKIDWSK